MYILFNKARIHYEISGEGAPLVLLHGNGEDWHYFDQQIPFFASRYQVIAIDSRAHGQSTRGEGALDFTLMAKDVLAVLNELKIKKTHILGFSDGGNVALQLALIAPDRVASLILNGANLSPGGMKKWAHLLILCHYCWLSVQALFSRSARCRKEVWGLMVFHPKLTTTIISAIKIPTLVIVGEHDMVSEKHTRAIASAIAGAQLCVIPNADHFVASKKAAVFNQQVANFLLQLQ